MNLRRFRARQVRLREQSDWTGKMRLGLSVRIDVSSGTDYRKICAVWDYVAANKCPWMGMSRCGRFVHLEARQSWRVSGLHRYARLILAEGQRQGLSLRVYPHTRLTDSVENDRLWTLVDLVRNGTFTNVFETSEMIVRSVNTPGGTV